MDIKTIFSQLRASIGFVVQSDLLTEDQKLALPDLFPRWEGLKNTQLIVNQIVSYGVNQWNETQLWQVIQTHMWQAEWTPDNAPSLFKKIGFADSGIPLWVQPLGAHDAYGKGDKVSHKDKIWISDINGNIWEPGVYGWTEE